MERLKRKKQSKWNKRIGFRINSVIKTAVLRIVVILVIVSLNWAGLSAVIKTFAYQNDTEDSNDNLFQASILDFSVTNRHIEDFIGMEALSKIEFASVVTKKTGSLNIQYEVNAEKITGSNDAFCDALKMKVEHNGVEEHDGLLLSFSAPTTTQLGTWEFKLDLPDSATNVPHGAECNVDLVFKGWRSDVATFEESGFTDEERIELRLTSRMIVLNEFLPNPSGLVPDYGFDFGEDGDSMPKGEWVELYNNSDVSQDLAGWYIWDNSGDSANKIEITTTNTVPSTTVIGAHSWLVVYMNKEVFDNDGDTVKLFNQNDELIDSHTYTGNDYCEIEPTPGKGNTSDTDGSCGGIPPNKSYARIPDGIGYWVDPIPTPGGPNILELEIINQEEAIEEEPIVEEIPTTEEEPVVEEEPIIEESASETGETTTTDTTEETTIIVDGLFVGFPYINTQDEPIISEETTTPEAITENTITTEEIQSETGEQPLNEESQNSGETPVIEEQPILKEEPVILPKNTVENETSPENTNSNQSPASESGSENISGEGQTGGVETVVGIEAASGGEAAGGVETATSE
jgi:hypothetical protein